MKKIIFSLFLAAALVSCAHDEVEYVDFDDPESSFKVVSESDIDLGDSSLWGDAWGGEQTKATSTTLALCAANIISSLQSKNVHQVVGTYTSSDLQGNPITVSGKIVYPKKEKVRNMIVVSHYTIGSNAEAPSESFSFESIYAALGYAVVIADYIGYGVTADQIHPYLQAEVTAVNVIDLAIAALPFLKGRNLQPESDEVILIGYSQGGAATVHVQRMLENDARYAGMFKIKKNYAGAGPYDIARTYDYSVKKDVTGIPCAVPMIIQGMSIGMSKPLEMSYFFREPLLSNYDEWINSKRYSVPQINEKIGSNRLSEILTENAADRTKDETARFYRELTENNVPETFIPEAPIFLFHSEDDETVPFLNSQMLQRQFRFIADDKVEYDFDHYGSHQMAAITFILKLVDKLE